MCHLKMSWWQKFLKQLIISAKIFKEEERTTPTKRSIFDFIGKTKQKKRQTEIKSTLAIFWQPFQTITDCSVVQIVNNNKALNLIFFFFSRWLRWMIFISRFSIEKHVYTQVMDIYPLCYYIQLVYRGVQQSVKKLDILDHFVKELLMFVKLGS